MNIDGAQFATPKPIKPLQIASTVIIAPLMTLNLILTLCDRPLGFVFVRDFLQLFTKYELTSEYYQYEPIQGQLHLIDNFF